MSDTIPTSQGDLTPSEIVDELTYFNYAWNRDNSDLPVETYAKYFGEGATAKMEERYQNDKR